MQEHAWEVGQTAKKGKKRVGLEGLEERQRGMVRDLDGIEGRFETLFALLRS